MNNSKKDIGDFGEVMAIKYLESIGYEIIEMNVSFWGGQLDVVAYFEGSYRFIEVKTRNVDYFQDYDDIRHSQVFTLVKSAERYLAMKCIYDVNWQIDLVVIKIRKKEIESIELIENITF